MTTEDRLRDALTARAASVEPRADGWTRIEDRMQQGSRTRSRRMAGLAAAAAALVAIAAVAVIAQQDDKPTPVVTDPGPGPSTTTNVPTTNVPTTTAPVSVGTARGPAEGVLWSYSFATPREAASVFARDFLGMPNPNVGEFQQGDTRSGEIVIHPKPTGTSATTLALRQYDGKWYVIAANAANLELDTPTTDERITSPVHLTGRSIAFEGNVRVAVLRYDTTMQCTVPTDSCGSDPGVYANTFFTGHGDQKAPFETDVTFTKPARGYGYVVLWTNSAEDGSLSEATVRLIRFA